MTKDQFLRVIRFYRVGLADEDDFGAPGTPTEAPSDAVPTLVGEQFRHLLFMCDRMEAMIEKDPEKAMRWLGFMQGVLWSLKIYTIDELRTHNTNPDLSRFPLTNEGK